MLPAPVWQYPFLIRRTKDEPLYAPAAQDAQQLLLLFGICWQDMALRRVALKERLGFESLEDQAAILGPVAVKKGKIRRVAGLDLSRAIGSQGRHHRIRLVAHTLDCLLYPF